VAVEAGVPTGWREFVGDSGEVIGIDHYGASADAATLFREFGFTADKVVAAAKRSLKAAAVADVIPAVTPDSARTDKPAAKATHRLAAKTSKGK